MFKSFDSVNNRLVYVDTAATPEYWEARWHSRHEALKTYKGLGRRTFVVKTTKKYLAPTDGPVLEGGCGPADKVLLLTRNGYQCTGIDFAKNTIETVKQSFPELDVRYGDVRKLDFADGHFAGYWSLGVIEHFHEGYDPIAQEMARVLRPGGYLFLTFPAMNGVRLSKSKQGRYRQANPQADPGFYQFALDPEGVVRHMAVLGLTLKAQEFFGVVTGLEEEAERVGPWLSKAKRMLRKTKPTKLAFELFSDLLEKTLAPRWGHSVLLVFQK
jgi:SAM-dependent methyltransferase